MLDRLRPQVVAVEDVFSARHVRSALALGQARGAVLAAVSRRGIPVHAFAPAKVKQVVAGDGRADKKQIQRMVQSILELAREPYVDEADAMAVALCYAFTARMRQS